VRKAIELPDFPLMIGVLLAVAGAAAAWRGKRPEALEPGTGGALVGVSVMLVLYVLLMQTGWLPYLVATIVFMLALGGWLMRRGTRRWGTLAVTACAVAGLCHVVFTRWLIVDLP